MPQFIRSVDLALQPSFCRSLIARFESGATPVHQGETGSGVDPVKKRSFDIVLDSHREWDGVRAEMLHHLTPHFCAYMEEFFFLLIGAMSPVVRHPRTGEATTLTAENFSEVGVSYSMALMKRCYRVGTVNLQKYACGIGGYPHWHSEVFPHAKNTDSLHRVLFWLCYLNDVEEGGETEFAYQDVRIQPRAGRLIIAPAGFTHTHRGNVPLSQDKYILASWIMYQPGHTFEAHSR